MELFRRINSGMKCNNNKRSGGNRERETICKEQSRAGLGDFFEQCASFLD